MWPFDVLRKLSREDGVIESLQFLLSAASAILALKYAKKIWTSKYKIAARLYIIFGIGMILVAGDEVSWGQRVLNIETPARLAEINIQSEFNWHNLSLFSTAITIGYIIVGFYGSFAWAVAKVWKTKNDAVDIFIPQSFLFFYFFIPFIYNLRTWVDQQLLGSWFEFNELMLYLGIFIFVSYNYFSFKSEKRLKRMVK
ncbi:MAG: hypothetical protein WBO70_06005 [Erysipelotrichaceae bacterium]